MHTADGISPLAVALVSLSALLKDSHQSVTFFWVGELITSPTPNLISANKRDTYDDSFTWKSDSLSFSRQLSVQVFVMVGQNDLLGYFGKQLACLLLWADLQIL